MAGHLSAQYRRGARAPRERKSPPRHGDAADLERLFSLSVQMLCVAGVDGYFRRINPAFERVLGYTSHDLLSCPFLDFVHPDDQQATLRELENLSRGMPTVGFENRYRCKDGSYRWLAWTSAPGDEDGLLYATALDITEHKRAHEELQSDLEIQKAIASILRASLEPISLEELFERTLDLVFSLSWAGLESKGAVFLIEDDPDVLVMKASRGLEPDVQAGCRTVRLGKCLCGQAAAERRIVFADRRDVIQRGPSLMVLPQAPGCVSPFGQYSVPMLSDGRLYGVLSVRVKPGHERSPKQDLFLSSVADALVGAVKRRRAEEALRQQEAQLVAAQAIQEHLLPDAAPVVPGLDIAGGFRPAEFVAGDWFDFVPLAGGSLLMVIGDVTGHGLAPALLAASTQALVRSAAQSFADPGGLLATVNALLASQAKEDLFTTLLAAQIDPKGRSLRYASAGHPDGYVLDPAGHVKARLESTAVPLGVLLQGDFPAGRPVALEAGDMVLLVTDGILEARSPADQPFGKDRLLTVVRDNRHLAAREIIEGVDRALDAHRGVPKLLDDVTLVVAKVLPAP